MKKILKGLTTLVVVVSLVVGMGMSAMASSGSVSGSITKYHIYGTYTDPAALGHRISVRLNYSVYYSDSNTYQHTSTTESLVGGYSQISASQTAGANMEYISLYVTGLIDDVTQVVGTIMYP